MGDLRKQLVELAAAVVRGNYNPTEPPHGRWSRVQKWRDHDAAVDRLKRLGIAIKDIADGAAKEATDAIRQIAAAIGTPEGVDPIADLPGLVMMVQAVAQRSESAAIADRTRRLELAYALDTDCADWESLTTIVRVNACCHADLASALDKGTGDGSSWSAMLNDVRALRESAIVAADAVAAERMAIGAWVRDRDPDDMDRDHIARSIEHGDHIDDDAPPLPSLRMVMLARDEAHKMLARRADEVERQAARIRELFDENCALRADVASLHAHTEATSPDGIGGTSGSLA